jgi:hypothetical protein
MELGIATAMARLENLPERTGQPGDVIVLSHVVAWEEADARRLLGFVATGGCLVLDATCGRKNTDASLHRPWPGGLAADIGLQAVDLESRPEGYELVLSGLPAGRWLLTRLVAELDPAAAWHAWEGLRFALDGESCVWERAYGHGRIVVVRGMLGPSLVHTRAAAPARYVLAQAGRNARPAVHPAGGHWATFAVPIDVEHGRLTAVLAPDLLVRGGPPMRVHMPAGTGLDLWSGETWRCDADGEVALPAPDGIALLWRDEVR